MKKIKLFFLITLFSVFGSTMGSILPVKANAYIWPRLETNEQFIALGDGKCVYAPGGNMLGSWTVSDKNNCNWEPCCKFQMTGYTDFEYMFKKSCSGLYGGIESIETDKSKCSIGAISCYCGTAKTSPTSEVIEEPKFTIPTFQIKIPGLDKLSEPTCAIVEGQLTCGISWISEYIFAIYNYGLIVVGIIAVFILMVAGLLWIVSGGDSTRIAKAKQLITGSITGLLLIVSMYTLLSYINPDLTKPKSIALSFISDIEPASTEGNIEGSKDCNNCTSIKAIPYDKREQGILNDILAKKLLTVYATNSYFYISESYPPTANHQSTCHYNGMCADIAITKTNYTCKFV